jgi:hypothetical protein
VRLSTKSREKIKAVHNMKEPPFILTHIENNPSKVIAKRKQSSGEESKTKLVVTLKKNKEFSSLTRIGSFKINKKQSLPLQDSTTILPQHYANHNSNIKIKQNTTSHMESGSMMMGRKFSLEKKEVKSCERMKKRKQSFVSLSKHSTFMNHPIKADLHTQGMTHKIDKTS